MSFLISRAVVITILITLFSSVLLGARRERLIEGWRPLHYAVNLTLDEQLSEIAAQATITVQILESNLSFIDFDFGRMVIQSVSINNQAVEYERPAGLLKLSLPMQFGKGDQATVEVKYRGRPDDGLILSRDKDGRPSAVGDNWPNRVHHWIPSLDHPAAKATVSFTVTAPARKEVVANGRLTGITGSTATRTWTFSEASPIPPYCMIVAVGEFARLEAPEPALTPLTYYVPPSDKKYALQGFAPAAPSLKVFSELIAPYPYDKLALIVGPTRFGGMENSSAIVFTNNLFVPRPREAVSQVFKVRRGIVNLVAHEIAHQWFGNSVTQSTWSDLWLSEGFATYFAALFIEQTDGQAAFQDYMREAEQQYLAYAARNRTPIFDDQTEDLMKLLNANNYQKGAWVLHMLRSQLGDETFFRGIQAYYNKHQSATASTEDLRAALEKESGSELHDFFESWVYGKGHPQYELRWAWNKELRKLRIDLRQTQPEAAFANPLPIDVVTKLGPVRFVLTPEGKEYSQEMSLEVQPLTIQADPHNTVLKEIRVRSGQPVQVQPKTPK